MRIIVTSLIGLALIAAGILGFMKMSEKKKANRPDIKKERAGH